MSTDRQTGKFQYIPQTSFLEIHIKKYMHENYLVTQAIIGLGWKIAHFPTLVQKLLLHQESDHARAFIIYI